MAKATSLAGKPLVQASYRLLMQDKAMVLLLWVGGLCSAVAFALVVVPASVVYGEPLTQRDGLVGLATYAAALLAATFVSTLFMGAVVAAATIRAEGGDPTPQDAMAAAWARRGPLLAWAAMSTAVGVVLRVLERLGIGGWLVRLLAGVAWAVATMFAVPVIMAEGTMPVETVRRSSKVLTSRFGSNVRATFRLGAEWTLLGIGAVGIVVVGVLLVSAGLDEGSTTLVVAGAVVALLGAAAVFVLGAVYSAVSVYLRTVLYRYAVGLPTPGVDPRALPPTLPSVA